LEEVAGARSSTGALGPPESRELTSTSILELVFYSPIIIFHRGVHVLLYTRGVKVFFFSLTL
jgi:hypothetical protein